MHAYLISGLPGTGKTTIEHELQKLGYEVINTDNEWGYDGNIETEEPDTESGGSGPDWHKTHGWIWSSKTVHPLLSAPRDKPLFICGGSRNESKFYDLFEKIFVLRVPDAVMRERLVARGDSNTSNEPFIKRMLAFNEDAYEHAKRINGIIIETARPLADCMKEILDTVHDGR